MAVKRAGKDKMVKGAPHEKRGTSARDKGGSRTAPTEPEEDGAGEAEVRKKRLIAAALGKRYAATFKVSGDGPALSEEEIAARDEAWDK